MDFSGEYQEMCEKAKEIQDHFWQEWVDVIYPEYDGRFYMLAKNRSKSGGYELNYFSSPRMKGKHIWLPTQDQLQEIIEGRFFDKGITIRRFVEFLESIYWGRPISFEQYWLAFVMKEKFNKGWTGEEWKEIVS